MDKASIALATRAPRGKRSAVRAPSKALPQEPAGSGYLKLGILLTMIFGPWAGIAYVAHRVFAGH